ncbi:MAG: ABC transporter ATP-binding protein [Oligoflexales bacterium]
MQEILNVKNLSMHFPILGGILKKPVGKVYALNDVSFTLNAGETLGVVGESGCGKTTLGRTLVRLYDPTAGETRFQGREINGASKDDLKHIRAEMQMVFQDPYSSLNPRMTIRDTLLEPLELYGRGNRKEREQSVGKILEIVGLRKVDQYKFPHEFSGGQRQRIGIARALILHPKLIIADEPVSALDVSIQSQILNLLVSLQNEFNLTYIFISHDLTVVKYISTKVAVMYLGRIVEIATAADIYARPQHPYTRALISAVPIPDPKKKKKGEVLPGDIPSPSNPPSGCAFHTRCKYAKDICSKTRPELTAHTGDKSHVSACHFVKEIQKQEDNQ